MRRKKRKETYNSTNSAIFHELYIYLKVKVKLKKNDMGTIMLNMLFPEYYANHIQNSFFIFLFDVTFILKKPE